MNHTERITRERINVALSAMLGALIEPPEAPMSEWEAERRNAEIRAKRLKLKAAQVTTTDIIPSHASRQTGRADYSAGVTPSRATAPFYLASATHQR